MHPRLPVLFLKKTNAARHLSLAINKLRAFRAFFAKAQDLWFRERKKTP
jgi:hypothetical protein